MTCPLCGGHELQATMFGKLFVARCPEVPRGEMRMFAGKDRAVVLESSRTR